MTDVRPEKLGDLQQVIRVVTSTGAVYFQEDPSLQDFNFCFATHIQCMHNTCTMEPLNVDSLIKGHISHSGHFLFNRV